MSEYIISVPGDEENMTIAMYGVDDCSFFGYQLTGEIVRCRDCKHATISSLGYVKYCEMFVLPDEGGYGANPQVNLPFDFFCTYGEPRGDAK